MPELIQHKLCAEPEGEIAVFLIGMRINKFWKIWRWFPVFLAMAKMLRELEAHPELGLLSGRGHFGPRNLMLLQYWRSAEHLRNFAHASSKFHMPAWRAFHQQIGTNGDVGIWHETYVIPPGHSESIYLNMPRYGLGLAGTLHPAKGDRGSAAKRFEKGKVIA